MEKKLNVEGMSCMHCVGRVQKYLETVAAKVEVDLATKEATFTPGEQFDMETAINEINALGFTATEK